MGRANSSGDNLMRGKPGAVGAGKTRRWYTITGTEKTLVLRLPAGVAFFGIIACATDVYVEQRDPPADDDPSDEALVVGNSRPLAADTEMPAGPAAPDELVIIRHQDDATDVGAVTVELEGDDLPAALDVEHVA